MSSLKFDTKKEKPSSQKTCQNSTLKNIKKLIKVEIEKFPHYEKAPCNVGALMGYMTKIRKKFLQTIKK